MVGTQRDVSFIVTIYQVELTEMQFCSSETTQKHLCFFFQKYLIES